MDFSLTTEHKSVTEPGVSFTLRRMGPKERALMELKLAPQRAELREMQERREELREKLSTLVAAAGVTPEGKPLVVENPSLVTPEMLKVSNEMELATMTADLFERGNIAPEIIAAGLKSVSDSGANIPLDAFNAACSDLLFTEVYQTIVTGAYLDPEAAKNSQPSTTTSAVAGGETSNTSADHAASADTTQAATAASTSPSA